jgi:SAM-dependent methyltransferase
MNTVIQHMKNVPGVRSVAREARALASRFYYLGDDVTCNVCSYRARSWLKGRPCGRCARCHSATRTRALVWYLQTEYLSPKSRILHFAPEGPLEKLVRRWNQEYTTCDLRRKDVTVNVDIQELPFADGAFDLVLCSHVLEHIPRDRDAMAELRRVCAPDGRVLIQVPLTLNLPTHEDLSDMAPSERKRIFGEVDHLRNYGLDIVERLASVGFRVEIYAPKDRVPDSSRRQFGIGDEQLIFVCSPAQT